MEFERRTSVWPVPEWLKPVTTTLRWRIWAKEMEEHPDENFRAYILNGISKGFRIGFDHRHHQCKSASANLNSALTNARVVQEYLDKERSLGRIIGPIPADSLPVGTHLSPFRVIPKSGRPGKWRLIVDLSSPEGTSVNAGIAAELCSLHYLHLDQVVQEIRRFGRGTQMAKMDIESAYRMVPVHPGDRPLLAVQWAGQSFFDTRLPFGL